MWKKNYLSEDELQGFDRYKYNSIDTSWLSKYVMHPFWNWCVEFVPIWVAPNLLTFSGFMLTVVNFLLIAYYDYDFKAAMQLDNYPIPKWVFLVVSINIFVAYTLDGIDGKQARRTGTSTPLGELFDHGLDSYSSLFIMIYIFSLFGTHDFPVIRMQFMTFCVYLNFYLSHFEKYNTGVMFLPYAYDFVMWGCAITFLVAFFFGPSIFVTPIFGFTPTFLTEILCYTSGVISSHPIIAWNIYKSYRDKTGKMRSCYEAAKPLYPVAGLFIVSTSWALFSPNRILSHDPRVFFMITGTIFSNVSCRLIVAQMSDTKCDGWNFQLTLYSIATAFCIFPYEKLGLPPLSFIIEKWILILLLALFSCFHFHYGYGIVTEMCKHFGIKCFTIKPKQNIKTANEALSIQVES
ncbi:CLUMA_CG014202, isoform A [Clunio marinus]|uniref:CLUMA_CG014202, isoform A n=1 Tax=Clunio marinus TaxID=568069 RepID=A0A1J1IMZ5_9DIPT|nr:CLUMA_CG014202, isoform A [Clunio marinus]